MPTMEDEITLSNLGQGAAEEKFGIELAKVIKNIRDQNTGGGKRVITLKATFDVADEDRSIVGVTVEVDSKLQPYRPYQTKAFVGLNADGTPAANEFIPQEQLSHPGMNVTPMRGGNRDS
jgi:hypothetical protein